MSSDDRRLLFCTYQHFQDGLDFKTGCWRKWCRSRAKFYSLDTAHRHKCGAPSGGSTYSYILSRDAEAEGGFKFVSKSSEEGIKTLKELGWEKTDLVWVPASTKLVPSIPIPRGAGKRQREIQKKQESQPPLKKQVLKTLQIDLTKNTSDRKTCIAKHNLCHNLTASLAGWRC